MDRNNASGREVWIVAGVAILMAFVMIFLVFGSQGWVSNPGDPYDYRKIAYGFLDHGFTKLTRRAAMLYPHLLAGVYWTGAGDFTVQMIHTAFHAGTCVLVFLLGRRLFNVRTGLIAGLLTAVHPMLLRYIADLHTETMLTFASTLMVWCAVRFYDRPTVANGLLFGVVGMLAALTKGVMLPFAVVFATVCMLRGLYQHGWRSRQVAAALAMFIAMAAVVTPWTYRNYKVSGRFVLLTPGTADAFLRGYIFTRLEYATLQRAPYVHAENESNQLFRRIAREAGTVWELDEVADEDNNKVVMKQMIRDHPLDTVRKVAVGLFTFWYEMTTFRNSLVPAVLALACWALAFVGLSRSVREQRPAWLVLLPIVVLNVFVALLVPLGRYSVPILPCLCLLAAFGAETLLERARARRAAVVPEPLRSVA